MRLWLTALTVALAVATAAATGSSADDATAGHKLYVAKCARCHKFYDPAGYDDAKWDSWLQRMKNKARLSDEQFTLLSRYLATVRASAAK